MQKESKDKRYANTGNEDVLRLIASGVSTILDVGCGSGSLARVLQSGGYVVDGITISAKELEEASAFLRTGYLHNLEQGLPAAVLKEQYDCVICSHVLEHIVYPDHLLRDIRTVLKPGGSLIVALPNVMHYKSRWRLVRGKFDYEETGIWDYTHVRWYTFRSGRRLLMDQGLVIMTATVTGELPLNSVMRKVLPSPLRRSIYKLLISASKGFFGYQLLYKAVKPVDNISKSTV